MIDPISVSLIAGAIAVTAGGGISTVADGLSVDTLVARSGGLAITVD